MGENQRGRKMKRKKLSIVAGAMLQIIVWFSVFSNTKHIISGENLGIVGICATIGLMICGAVFIRYLVLKALKSLN